MFGSKSKIFFTIALVLMFVVLIFGLFFMTQYANVHVFYNKSIDPETGKTVIAINAGSNLTIGSQTISNLYLFNYMRYNTKGPFAGQYTTIAAVSELMKTVYNFQISASKFNDLIIGYFITGLICVGSFYLFDNHKRNTYYISNLVIGLLAPLAMIIFSVIMIVKDLDLLNNFGKNKDLYQIVGVMQDPNIGGQYKGSLSTKEFSELQANATNVNNLTMIIAIVIFAIIAAYFTFLLVFTLMKYKATSKARKETIERAATAND